MICSVEDVHENADYLVKRLHNARGRLMNKEEIDPELRFKFLPPVLHKLLI